MSIIFHSHRWIWRCCRSYRRATGSENNLTRCKLGASPGLCVTSSLCLSVSSKQNNVSNVEGKMFQELIFNRRRQAHCSFIIEVKSHSSLSRLFKHIEKMAKVKKILWRKLNSKQEYILVECENPSDVKSLLKKCNYSESLDSVPVTSRILKSSVYGNQEESLSIPCEAYDVIGENTINKKLQESENITEQMKDLQRYEQLSEIDTRLHFFICSQIEDALSGLFPDCVCLPFGSAVNGFGCAFGDLDMNLNLNGKKNAENSLLSFIPKRTLACDRFQGQRMLETIGDILQTFVPGISQLVKILKARIPILKFHHDIARMQCDLTINNMSGVYMAEVLYTYGEMDPCVRPLVHTIRRWARKNQLTSDGSGSKITNFSLILMIIFFLQTRTHPILSPISRIEYAAERGYANALQSGNVDNYSKISNAETTNLESLLMEFFVFCATFKFENAMCLDTGTTTPKPDYSSLYIHNPVEKGLNVSKNVIHPELKKATEAAKLALWEMEKSCNSNDRDKPWGIMKLFNKHKTLSSEEVSRRFQISSLFEKKKADGFSNHPSLEKHHRYVQVTDIGTTQAKTKSKLYAQKRKFKT